MLPLYPLLIQPTRSDAICASSVRHVLKSVPDDGVDQDCDGFDLTDADLSEADLRDERAIEEVFREGSVSNIFGGENQS